MYGPGLHVRQGSNGQPVQTILSNKCHCQCHGRGEHPPAVEARLCANCAEDAFAPWTDILRSLHG